MMALVEPSVRTLVAKRFAARFFDQPRGVVFTPGRVNLIGEHVDYNDGLVLPMPIAVGTAIAWRARADGRVTARAADFGDEEDSFAIGEGAPDVAGWRAYVRGMTACMADRGLPVAGADIVIAGSIPRGSGLSSSASLCVAVGRALSAAAGFASPDPIMLSLVAQQAEHRFAGVRCGIMDQVAVAAGKPGHAVLIDCRSLATRHVAMPRDWAVMIVQSGVARELVEGHYNRRRAECEAAVRALGMVSLRDATPAMIDAARLDPVVHRRARHVVSEIGRTNTFVDAVARGHISDTGALLRASHRSLRDDFEVSVPQVDRLVDALNRAIGDAGGARMTGGGFGGAAVAVLRGEHVEAVRAQVLASYSTPAGDAPDIMVERFDEPSADRG